MKKCDQKVGTTHKKDLSYRIAATTSSTSDLMELTHDVFDESHTRCV